MKTKLTLVLNSLYDLSPIHGFSFLNKARTKTETFFWCLAMIVFFIILAVQISMISKDYFSGKTLAKVSVTHHDSLNSPAMFVCLSLEMIDLILDVNESDECNRTEDFFDPLENWFKYLDHPKYLNSTTEFSRLWREELRVTHLLYLYLMTMSDFEGNLYFNLGSLGKRHRNYQLCDFQTYDLWYFERTLERFDIKLNTLKHELAQHIFGIFFTEATLSQKNASGYVTNNHFDGSRMYSLDRNQICFNLTMPNKLFFGPPNPLLTLRVNYSNLSTTTNETNTAVHLLIAKGDSNLHCETELVITGRRNSEETAIVKNFASFVSDEFTRSKSDCSPYLSASSCRSNCIGSLLQQICNCTPTFLTLSEDDTSTQKLCWLSTYLAAPGCYNLEDLNVINLPENAHECMKNCKSTCDKTRYMSLMQSGGKVEWGDLVITASLEIFEFPTYAEIPAFTWETFLGACGGSLGIWFGASVLSLIHIVFLAIQFVCETMTNKIKPSLNEISKKMSIRADWYIDRRKSSDNFSRPSCISSVQY